MRSACRQDSGVFYILLIFLVLVFMGLLALLYDIGRILITTRQLQNTADGVSLAATEGLEPSWLIDPNPLFGDAGAYHPDLNPVPTAIVPTPIVATQWKLAKVRAWSLVSTAPNIDYQPGDSDYDLSTDSFKQDTGLYTLISAVPRPEGFQTSFKFDDPVPSGMIPAINDSGWRGEVPTWPEPEAGPVPEPTYLDESYGHDYPGFKGSAAIYDSVGQPKMELVVRRGLRCFGGPKSGLSVSADERNWYDLEGSNKWCWANAVKAVLRVDRLNFFFARIWGVSESSSFSVSAISDWRPSPYSCGEPACSRYTGGVTYSALSDLPTFYSELGRTGGSIYNCPNP